MKKIIAILLAAMMLLSLAACGSKETKPTEPAAEEAPATQTETFATQAEAAPTEAETSDWGVPQSFLALGKEFYVSFPELSGIPQGSGLTAYQPDGSLCILDAQYTGSPEVASVSEVLPAYFEQTDDMLTFYYAFRGSDFTYPIDSQEMVSINGYDMCKYKGHLLFKYDGVDTDYKYVAYSVQLTTGEYAFWMVVDETPDQTLGDSIEDCAYNMALSFREG